MVDPSAGDAGDGAVSGRQAGVRRGRPALPESWPVALQYTDFGLYAILFSRCCINRFTIQRCHQSLYNAVIVKQRFLSRQVMLETAQYLEDKRVFDAAVQLYQKAGQSGKALELCFRYLARVCERERERETDRQTETKGERGSGENGSATRRRARLAKPLNSASGALLLGVEGLGPGSSVFRSDRLRVGWP